MLQSADSSFASTDSTRRRSTFYVPLVSDLSSSIDTITTTNLDDIKKSLELIYNPDLSACSFEWSLDDSLNRSSLSNDGNVSAAGAECTVNGVNIATVVNMANTTGAKAKRYGVVLNGIDLDDEQCHQQSQTSTPKKMLAKSESRSSIPDRTFNAASPALKEKSATLPQNMSPANTFPPKHSFLLKSSPKISFNYSSDAAIATTTPSPKKTLSFIRRAHSTKLSRSNSLLKSLTSKCVDQSVDNLCRIVVDELQFDRLERFFKAENCTELIRDMFFKVSAPAAEVGDVICRGTEDNDIHSGKNRFNLCFYFK